MKNVILTIAVSLAISSANAFCGFYVAKAGANLYNNKSEVILVRDGEKTTLTMSNDFKGSVRDFAMVVPVPELLKESDIRVVNRDIFDRIDAYSAPRMVEYHDPAPCGSIENVVTYKFSSRATMKDVEFQAVSVAEDKYQVTIEAQYTIGEYDIIILSAEQSGGLESWLKDNGYSIPDNAREVLQPYINDKLKFFVVKVNLNNVNSTGFDYLRPIQITYNSSRFMLPIRLGMANAKSFQDLVVYTFTKSGRVECTNYRTEKMPTGNNIPTFVLQQFDSFYIKTFNKQYLKNNRNAVFLEYAWNVTPTFNGMKCDPCVGNPPMPNEFTEAGVSWLGANPGASVFFTRLHVRYSRNDFPQDLMFQVTPNTENYQARYVITHPSPYTNCEKGKEYLAQVEERKVDEVLEFCKLTGERTKKYEWYAVNLTKSLPTDDGNTKSIRQKIIQMFEQDTNAGKDEDSYAGTAIAAGNSDDGPPQGSGDGPLYLLLLPLAVLLMALYKKTARHRLIHL
jgi:hypothetical protein